MYLICCVHCGKIIAAAEEGSRSIIQCKKCRKWLSYEIHEGKMSIKDADRREYDFTRLSFIVEQTGKACSKQN